MSDYFASRLVGEESPGVGLLSSSRSRAPSPFLSILYFLSSVASVVSLIVPVPFVLFSHSFFSLNGGSASVLLFLSPGSSVCLARNHPSKTISSSRRRENCQNNTRSLHSFSFSLSLSSRQSELERNISLSSVGSRERFSFLRMLSL